MWDLGRQQQCVSIRDPFRLMKAIRFIATPREEVLRTPLKGQSAIGTITKPLFNHCFAKKAEGEGFKLQTAPFN